MLALINGLIGSKHRLSLKGITMPIAIGYDGYIVRTIFFLICINGLEETIGVTLTNNFVVDIKFIENYNLDRIEDLDSLARWSDTCKCFHIR